MSFSKLAVSRPVATAMFFLGILIVGAYSFTQLKVDLLPEIDFPAISVVTQYEGAAPEEMETIITKPMERALSTLDGVDSIDSTSANGTSRVQLKFVWGTNVDNAVNEVRAIVDRARSGFPDDVQTPVIYKFNLSSTPVIFSGVYGNSNEVELREITEKEIAPRLERLDGVASASILGGIKRQIVVQLDPSRLRALNISAEQVVRALRSQNHNVPAGSVEQFDEKVVVRTIGQAQKVDDFQNIIVTTRTIGSGDGATVQPIYVKDVGAVVDTFQDAANYVYINGKPGLLLGITKQTGANSVEVSARAQAEFKRINRDLDGRVRVESLIDTSNFIVSAIDGVRNAILIGAVLAVLVLLFFLRDIRSVVVISLGIPISIIGIFTLMYYFHVTLNMISFGGVSLGVGMLVDNAIVILENIFRKTEEGLSPIDAAVEGSREVSGAIVASTLTTVMVFLPIIFLSGFASIFFGQMAFVVTFALVCSLLVALTLVPVLSSKFLKEHKGLEGGNDFISRGLDSVTEWFGKLVDYCLDHKIISMIVATLLLFGSIALVPAVGTELLPVSDQSAVKVNMKFPKGTRLEVTDAAIHKIEKIVTGEIPEMINMMTTVGQPGFWSRVGTESAEIQVFLVKPNERKRSSEAIANAVRPKLMKLIPGAEIRVDASGGLWIFKAIQGGGERFQVEIRGHDTDDALRVSNDVVKMLETIPGVSGAQAALTPGVKEFRIEPARDKLASFGLSFQQVASQIQVYLQGQRATVFRERGDEFEVLVRLNKDDARDYTSLLSLPIILPSGGTTPLGNVATIEKGQSPVAISRENQSRTTSVSAVLDGTRDLGSIAKDARAKIKNLKIPKGFSVIIGGENEEKVKTFRSLGASLLLAVLLVYMVMAAQFESFAQPIMIMFSIPFAAVGVILALVVTHTTFNLQSFMGVIVLVGIVVNNAIVLIDYVNLMRREHGMSVKAALSLSARRRLRPILMTSLTTILALIPVAIGLGEGSETQSPLARVVIGGMLTSSVISLLIIPILYDAVEGRKERRKLRKGEKAEVKEK